MRQPASAGFDMQTFDDDRRLPESTSTEITHDVKGARPVGVLLASLPASSDEEGAFDTLEHATHTLHERPRASAGR